MNSNFIFASPMFLWSKVMPQLGILTRDFYQVVGMNIHRPRQNFVASMVTKLEMELKKSMPNLQISMLEKMQPMHQKQVQIVIDGLDHFERGLPNFVLACFFSLSENQRSFFCVNPITGDWMRPQDGRLVVNDFALPEEPNASAIDYDLSLNYVNLLNACANRVFMPKVKIEDDSLLNLLADTEINKLVKFI